VGSPGLPHLPLLRLRASRGDVLLRLIERQPAWAHAVPARASIEGDRGVSCYRLASDSFFVQAHWRWRDDGWQEREVEVVPGAAVALRLALDDVDPQWVTRALGLAPSRAFAKDVERAARARGGEGLWIHEAMPGAWCFPEEKLAELLGVLRGCAGWREVLGRRGVTWAGVSVKLRAPLERLPGFALEPRVLEDLVGLSLALDVEVVAE
jgi:hypothetical protein